MSAPVSHYPRCPASDPSTQCECGAEEVARLSAQLATARSDALEEAARWHDARREDHEYAASDSPDTAWKHIPAAAAHGASADHFRALKDQKGGQDRE